MDIVKTAVLPAQDMTKIESVLVQGNLIELTVPERVNYYKTLCETLGLNPLTKPFEYLTFQGKLTLYATRACSEQLRQLHSVSIEITKREQLGELYVVTAKGTTRSGRSDESQGALVTAGLKGVDLANAYMKCETKAKRRVTLSICGLGFLDESERDGMVGSRTVDENFQLVKPEQPSEGDGFIDPEYRFPHSWGAKLSGKYLKDVSTDEIKNLVTLTDNKIRKAKDTGGKVAKLWTEFVEAAEKYLGDLENQEPEGKPDIELKPGDFGHSEVDPRIVK